MRNLMSTAYGNPSATNNVATLSTDDPAHAAANNAPSTVNPEARIV